MGSYRAQREGDPNVNGGIATGGAISVRINGALAGYDGMTVTPHAPCPIPSIHCSAITVSTCQSVIIEGRRALRTGIDVDNCMHPRAVGSIDVLIGD